MKELLLFLWFKLTLKRTIEQNNYFWLQYQSLVLFLCFTLIFSYYSYEPSKEKHRSKGLPNTSYWSEIKKKKFNSKPLIIYLKKNFFIIHNLQSIKELQYKQQAHGHIIYILPHTMEHYWGLCASAVLC